MNTNAKPTPGPWKIKKDRFSQSVWAGNERIAEMMGWGKNRRRANARLIAAAPAMLEALRLMMDTTRHCDGRPYQSSFDAARAAIAQAEGGAQ
jgi:hypothetical protein